MEASGLTLTAERNISHPSLLITAEISFSHFLKCNRCSFVCAYSNKMTVQVLTVISECLQSAKLIRTRGKSKLNLPREWDQPLHYLLSFSTIKAIY